MLLPMPEKENKVKTSKKTSPKKTAGKTQSKTKSRTGTTTAKKKPRSSTARKKRSHGNIIAALVILCVLLLGLNLVLVLKLVPNLKNSLKQDTGTAQTQVQQDKLSTEQKRNEPLTAAQEPSPPVTVPQGAAQAQPHTDSAVQQKRQNTPATQQKTVSSQEKAPTAKKTTPAAQPAPHSPAAASEPRTTSATQKKAPAIQKDTAKKEQPAVHAAPQKNTVPEKPAVPDKKNTKNTVPEKPAVPDKKKAVQTVQPMQPAAKPEKPRKRAPYAGNLTFVFDDAGHNLDQLEYFLRLPFPCTIAVLPGLRYSSESARQIRKAGKQVILHQPMQSVDLHINPGPGAVTPGLSAEQIKNIVRKNLEEIWPVAGMNNHEGSLMTADEAAMSAVLDVVAEKHIFFLDSRTTARSVVAKVAKEKNMAVWERAIFIDNDKSRAAMETQIKKGLSIARQKGSAIMIGHVFTVELAELLTEMYPALIEDGFSLSAIAQVAQKDTVNFGN
ncbi:divergent polysaccharide deacetylase family protein [Treponema sp. OMZ 857]|uniref:divergent polysaccharide deacetylase family protein n=1 Tax=Treponema sp. OMZ 857 TaxID=1643513 RepID=UPI0020A5E21E|nr:divergent polysaccharide deacetylase family protein [Treponema sp. OMZ 857]UTC43796.1 divergent polysaccharide deacetylase family protein [Treponema sp. OMZ 857]